MNSHGDRLTFYLAQNYAFHYVQFKFDGSAMSLQNKSNEKGIETHDDDIF